MRTFLDAYTRDALGSVTEISDESGAWVESYTYDVFGAPKFYDAAGNLLPSSAVGNTTLFTGRRYESESGLYHYRARFYSPKLGRFLQPDPIGYAGGINIYAYCLNDPVNYVDPWGLDTYRQNRQLNPRGATTRRPVKHGISHTFIYTTHPDGSLNNTYSCGNEPDSTGNMKWYKNRPEDRSAASTAIAQKQAYDAAPWWKKPTLPDNFGPRVGGPTMDGRVEQLFQQKEQDPNDSSRHPWRLNNNCKHETDRLIDQAK
jgi:RHS repeat-associated protein